MNVQDTIHKLATDKAVTEYEFLELLTAILKFKEAEERRKTFNRISRN